MGLVLLTAAVLQGAAEEAPLLTEIAGSALRSSLVVELWVRKWEGREPEASGWHRYTSSSASEALGDNRPIECPGILTGEGRTVLVRDPVLARSFITRAAVSKGERRVPAVLSGCLAREPGVLFRLERDLPGATPLRFGQAAKDPRGVKLFAAEVHRDSDGWLAKAYRLGGAVMTNGHDLWVGAGGGPFLVFSEAGEAVGYSLSGMLGVSPGR